ncbi:methylamine utilization protein [soil metagenome]
MNRVVSRFWIIGILVALGASSQARADNKDKWGGVKGQIFLDATAAPVPVQLQVTKDQGVCLAKGQIDSEALIVNKANLGVKNVFVWLIPEDVKSKEPLDIHPSLKAIKKKEVEVDQPCCMFVPHALCMREGQTLVAKNSSTIAHNFHWTGDPRFNPGGNSIIPAGKDLQVKDLTAAPTPVKMACDVHPWMNGWIRVFKHPYYALTDKDGKFEIKNAPAGPCRIVIWHEEKGWVDSENMEKGQGKFGRKIEIPAGKTLERDAIKMGQP